MMPQKRAEILVVEDDDDLRKIYRTALEHQGYEVTEAHDRQTLQDVLDRNRFEFLVVICDNEFGRDFWGHDVMEMILQHLKRVNSSHLEDLLIDYNTSYPPNDAHVQITIDKYTDAGMHVTYTQKGNLKPLLENVDLWIESISHKHGPRP